MNRETVERTVKEVLAKKLSKDASSMTGETRLAEDLGLDSFGGVEVMFEIEEAFELKVADSDIAHVRTVNDIVNYIIEWKEKMSQPVEPPKGEPS